MDLVKRSLHLLAIMVVVIIGFGFVIPMVTIWSQAGHPLEKPTRYELLPAPWLVPKQAGGTALRMAMIHDVLHERFYFHGPAWFEHRHRQVERELATYDDGGKAKDARYFALLDDFAVDFDRLGKPAEGIPILRRKLDLQQPLEADGKRPGPEAQFYTTYANLGTLLAHQYLKGALAKDPQALAGLREGLAFIEQSVAVNPDAHFGRERWQVVTLRYLLRASERPAFLTTSDVGGMPWDTAGKRQMQGDLRFSRIYLKDDTTVRRLQGGPRSEEDEVLVGLIRGAIPTMTLASEEWYTHCGQGMPTAIPFDEPALAMVGIWTLGSGANPHFALAFAHQMEWMGQPGIAWNAYERAADLAGKFWSDPTIRQQLTSHCRQRQAHLETALQDTGDHLREKHRAELAYGRAEQTAYHAYEAERIAAGRDPAEPDFYADFFHNRPPIASDPGSADTIVHDLPIGGFDLFLIAQAVVCAILTGLILLRIFNLKRQLAA